MAISSSHQLNGRAGWQEGLTGRLAGLQHRWLSGKSQQEEEAGKQTDSQSPRYVN